MKISLKKVSTQNKISLQSQEDGYNAKVVNDTIVIGSGGKDYVIGDGLKLDELTNTLSVDTTNNAEEDNTKPITSAGVYTQLGNINVLLSKI